MPKNAIARGVAMGQLTVYEVKALRVQEAKILEKTSIFRVLEFKIVEKTSVFRELAQ